MGEVSGGVEREMDTEGEFSSEGGERDFVVLGDVGCGVWGVGSD
jgi:hypothetical protein